MIRYLQNSLMLGFYSIVFLFLLWAMAALYVDASIWFSLALLLICVISGFYFRLVKRISVFVFLACFTVLIWWIMLPPSNDRDWRFDVSRLPGATIDGTTVSVSNVRNFRYQSESSFTENWETREYDLDKLVGLDLFLVTWGLDDIAHTIVSWRFSDGAHLAVSIETRKEKHEVYSAFKGFFRQFEIYYVVADERDVIKIRTDHLGEKVRLYNLKLPLENARALLLEYFREINKLKAKPRWYNALTHNCTTAIRYHNQQIGAAGPLDWRLFLNDHLDDLGYERGVLDQSLPLEELRKVSDITNKAKSIPADENFSAAIREGLPGFAFPSRTIYMGKDTGLDEEAGADAIEQVRAWRRTGQLPFPRLSPEQMEHLDGTLDYPPRGSPEAGQEDLEAAAGAERLSVESVAVDNPADEPDAQEENGERRSES